MGNPKILLKILYVYTLKIVNCEIVIFSENESKYFSIFKCAFSFLRSIAYSYWKTACFNNQHDHHHQNSRDGMKLLDGFIWLPQCNLASLLLASLFLLGSSQSRNFSCSCCTSRKWLIISRTGSINIVKDVKLDLKVYAFSSIRIFSSV